MKNVLFLFIAVFSFSFVNAGGPLYCGPSSECGVKSKGEFCDIPSTYTLILDKSGNVINPLDDYSHIGKFIVQEYDGFIAEVLNRTYCNGAGDCTTTKTSDFCGIGYAGRRGLRHLQLSGCKSTN